MFNHMFIKYSSLDTKHMQFLFYLETVLYDKQLIIWNLPLDRKRLF